MITGSYNYPGLYNDITAGVLRQATFSQYSGVVPTLPGKATLYVSGTGANQNLYFKNELGTSIALGSGSSVSVSLSGAVSGADNFFINDGLDVRGFLSSSTGDVDVSSSILFVNTDKNYHIAAKNGYLILSSSAGSVVVLSASQDFTETDKNYHIASKNSHLILSSSAGSVVALSASQDFVEADKNYHIRSVNSHFILSSSAGSVVALSASQDFTETDKNYHIASKNSDLILSSSTSKVNISGNLKISKGADGLMFSPNSAASNRLTLQNLNGTTGFTLDAGNFSEFGILNNAGNAFAGIYPGYCRLNQNLLRADGQLRLSSSAGSTIVSSGAFRVSDSISNYSICGDSSHFILSSSAGSVVALSASQDFTETDKNYHIRSVNSDLILSSSAGSNTTVSGALKVMEAINARSSVTVSGEVLGVSNIRAGGTYAFYWVSSTRMSAPSNGSVLFSNFALNDFSLLYLGSTGSDYPAIKRVGNTISFRSGTDDVAASVSASNGIFSGHLTSLSLTNANSHLILSSSAGSVVTISGNLNVLNQAYGNVNILQPSGANQTQDINWNTGNVQILMLNSSSLAVTASFSNPQTGASYVVKVLQHDTAPIDVNWPSTTYWPDGILPVVSNITSSVDVVSLLYDGTSYYATIGQNFAR